jgi:hypothetical protein
MEARTLATDAPPTIGPLASSGCRPLLRVAMAGCCDKHQRIQRSAPSLFGCPRSGGSVARQPVIGTLQKPGILAGQLRRLTHLNPQRRIKGLG